MFINNSHSLLYTENICACKVMG